MGGYWGSGDHGTEKERGHITKSVLCGKRARESLTDGREVGEGRGPQTNVVLVFLRKAGWSWTGLSLVILP